VGAVTLRLVAVVLRASFADGGLGLIEIDDVVALHAGDLAPCHNPKASGSIELEFSIVDGGVESAAVLRDARPAAASCFMGAVSGWQFPRRPPTSVRYAWAPAKKSEVSIELFDPLELQWRRRGDIARCYLDHRKAPADDGPLGVSVVVGRSGVVLLATLERIGGRFSETALGACALDVVRSWRFPEMKTLGRAALSWQLAPSGPIALEPNVVPVTELEPTTATTADIPFHAALLTQTAALAVCRASTETLVMMRFKVGADGGLTVVAERSNPPTPQLEQCVAGVTQSFSVPLKPGESHDDAWLFFADGGVTAYQTTTRAGGLAKSAIMKVIKEHQEEIKACYERQLARNPNASGKVALLFVIGASGAVEEARAVEVSDGLGPVAECAAARIRTWGFPEPAGGGKVTVTFPWVFKPAR